MRRFQVIELPLIRHAAVLLLVVMAAGAAWSAPGTELPRLLDGLDPSGVSSGILYDRALDMADAARFDGTPQAPAATAGRWRQLAHQMTLASLETAAWPTADRTRALAREQERAGLIPLGLLDFRYQRLQPNALDAGLVTLQGEELQANVPASQLYRDGRLFAAAVMAPRTFRGQAVRFVLPRSLMLGNVDGAAPRLQADFDDGAGWRALQPDVTVAVSYGAVGSRTIRVKAVYPSGEVLLAAAAFDVAALVTPAPTDTLVLTASVPWDGAAATGEAYVYLAPDHAVLTEPVVVVEGFDLDNSMNWDELYALLNTESLIEDMRTAGYDAVVLNFTESTEPIQRNAMLLVELLQQVQALQADGRDLVVIGASMGGLVARYGLAWMEQNGVPHHARTYVSFDTPQAGANIPLGVQYWLQLFQIESTDAAYLLGRLDTPAARQMLLYHHTSPAGTTGAADPLRASFLADLAAVGDYPELPDKIAVANGSGTGMDQGYAAGAQLISYEYYSFLVDITGNVWAVPDGSSQMILNGLINRIWPLSDDALDVTVSGTRPWDNAPGGSRASLAEMDAVPAPYGDIVALHNDHCFIPTVSALDLPTDDPFFDIAGQADLAALTPFDAVHVPAENQPHVQVTPENKVWFMDAVRRYATPVDPVIPPGADLPGAMVLTAAPNPFNPRTEIAYAVPASGDVALDVFDARGRHLRTLVRERREAGVYTVDWDGRDDAGRALPSGVYFCRAVSAAGAAAAERVTLVR